MVVICHWPHLPRQVEVQQRMESVQEWYATFLLCTPTSIMPVENNGERKRGSSLGRPDERDEGGSAHQYSRSNAGRRSLSAANRVSLPSRRVNRGS